jgi:hypothetical protein
MSCAGQRTDYPLYRMERGFEKKNKRSVVFRKKGLNLGGQELDTPCCTPLWAPF